MSEPTRRHISPRMRRLAYTIPLLTLPSGLWRIVLVAGVPVMAVGPMPLGERVYIVGLSLAAEVVALLCVGLTRPWSESVPRWVPVIGGRTIPRLAVTVPAALGAVALTAIWTYGTASVFREGSLDAFPHPAQKVLLGACYLPLLAWGPIVAILTVDYHIGRKPGMAAVSLESSGRRPS